MRAHGWLCFILLLAPVGALRAAEPVPLEAFAAAPQTTNVAISPNGAQLAWCVTNGNDIHVVVFDVSKQQYLRTLPLDKANTLVWLRWVDDETVLYSVRFLDTYRMQGGEYRRYFTRVFAVDVPTGKRRNLLM